MEAPWGPRWGLKGGHLKSFENSGCHLELQNTQKEPPRDPQNHPKRGPREPQNDCKTIFGSKTLYSYSKINIFEGGRVSLGVQNRPQEAPRGDKKRHRQPHHPPKAISGSKRRANQAQENFKMNLEALFGRLRGPSGLPRAPQELPKGARESPKTIAKPFLDRKR